MRVRMLGSSVVALAVLLVVLAPGRGADATHRDGFNKGSEPVWIKGDGNIAFTEKAHSISDEHARNDGTSEYIKIAATPLAGATTAEYAHYYYRTPPAPVTSELLAGVYVKSALPGVQLKARVVFPKEKDPKNPDAPLTTLVAGDTYQDARTWKQLSMGDLKVALQKQLATLTAKLGRQVDETGAYVDCLVLNVYTGAGTSEVWIDDLAIGPVVPGTERKVPGKLTTLASRKKNPAVTFSNGDILIDMHDEAGERPFFFRAIRHSQVPLAILEQARFNTIWFPEQVSDETYEEAVRAKFFLVPTLPLPKEDWDDAKANPLDPKILDRDVELVSKNLRKFLASDAVLMWDLGSGRTSDQIRRVAKLADTVRTLDPRRPRAVDVWDGYSSYSSYVDAIGGHRWPLFTSLEMGSYKDWLAQRRALTAPGKLNWTHVQTHLPSWYQTLMYGRPDNENFAEPIGPHPEQIRLLTYLAVASGYRGLVFWSDQFLSDACHGQDRLHEIALLNAELELLEPILLNTTEGTQWISTSDPNVFAAVIRSVKETVVMPIYFGNGTQFCPDQMAVNSLTINVPKVPEGATAWRLNASGLDEIKDLKRVAEGTQMTFSEFDTTAAIVLTTDVTSQGRLVRLQENTKHRFSRWAAYVARRQAWVQYQKTAEIHKLICQAGAPPVQDALKFFQRAQAQIEEASKYTDNNQPEMAYLAARRSQRPLRLLMHEHWRHAVEHLDVTVASPYAISVYSLPKHWELFRYISTSQPAGNAMAHGRFDLSSRADADGAAVASLPGWIARKQFADAAQGRASIVNCDAEFVQDPLPVPPLPKFARYEAVGRPYPTAETKKACASKPDLGSHVLQLKMEVKGDPLESPKALERSFIAVDSPIAEFAPGTWVRISFWMKVPGTSASADGALAYDSAGGEPLAVRYVSLPEWKHFNLYRQVPATGKIQMTFALTGFGSVLFDDLRIEPMMPGGSGLQPQMNLPLLANPTTLPKPLPAKDDDKTLPKPKPYDPEATPSEALPKPRSSGRDSPDMPLPKIPELPATPKR